MLAHRLNILLIAAMALFLTPACASLPSVNDEGISPRRTTTAAIETTIGVLDDLTTSAKSGLLSDNFADDVVQFAPDVTERATVYLDNTAACVVIDGALQTDPATGRPCSKSEITRAFGSLSDILTGASNAAFEAGDTDIGRTLGLAAIVVGRWLRPASGDVWTGYSKDPDITLDQFNASRADLRAAMDRLVEAATAVLSRT